MVEFAANDSVRKAFLRDSRELDEHIYLELADAEIILAHRERGWIESDPRRLERWFTNAIDFYGEIVRDISRAFKALRDARFDDGLSSICIMASVVRAIERIGKPDASRLDLALINVAREIARRAGEPVHNPVFPEDPGKHLCLGWSEEYREKVRALFRDAADQLEEAVEGTFHKSIALNRARAAFGPRVPDDENLIALTSVVATVRSIPAEHQPQAMVPRTRSG